MRIAASSRVRRGQTIAFKHEGYFRNEKEGPCGMLYEGVTSAWE